MNNQLINLTGKQFGIWQVIEQAPRRDNKTRWLCECVVCGARMSLRGTVLRSSQYARCLGYHQERAPMPASPLKKAPGYAAATEVFNLYRTRAKTRGFTFSLRREQFDRLTQSACHYCGAPPRQRSTRRHFNGVFVYNGIDRLDSTRGYEPDNCVPCCYVCNVMKQDLTYAAFVAQVARIYQLHGVAAQEAGQAQMAFGRGGNFRVAIIEPVGRNLE